LGDTSKGKRKPQGEKKSLSGENDAGKGSTQPSGKPGPGRRTRGKKKGALKRRAKHER